MVVDKGFSPPLQCTAVTTTFPALIAFAGCDFGHTPAVLNAAMSIAAWAQHWADRTMEAAARKLCSVPRSRTRRAFLLQEDSTLGAISVIAHFQVWLLVASTEHFRVLIPAGTVRDGM